MECRRVNTLSDQRAKAAGLRGLLTGKRRTVSPWIDSAPGWYSFRQVT